MKKLNIKKLKLKQIVPQKWSQEEIKNLKKLKKAGIFPSTIISDYYTMSTFFPNRTKMSLLSKYNRI